MTDLFDHLRALRLPRGEYAVFGSGPLAVRGILDDPSDLDVLVSLSLWRVLERQHPTHHLQEFDVDLVEIEVQTLRGPRTMTFGTEWKIGEVDPAALIADAEILEGLPFVRLEHVVAYKRALDRPKDREHLRLLEESGLLGTQD